MEAAEKKKVVVVLRQLPGGKTLLEPKDIPEDVLVVLHDYTDDSWQVEPPAESGEWPYGIDENGDRFTEVCFDSEDCEN